MHSQAQDIIRTIREALHMSRAEFARALGWSPSTIARWESGKAQPNRLSLKIILAFGEERGVRWRPRQTLPAPLTAPARVLPALAVRPVEAHLLPDAGAPATPPRRPRWEAAVSFRVTVDRSEPTSRRWLGNATVAAAFCTVMLLGLSVFTTGASSSQTPERLARVAAPVVVEPGPAKRVADVATSAAAEVPAQTSTDAGVSPVIAPAPMLARLEGVTLLGTVRRATFRTDDDALTIAEGEQLGDRHAVRIAVNGVQFADAAGEVRVVRLGETLAIQ